MIPDLSSATSPDAPPTASEDAAPPPKAIVLVIKKKRRSGQGKRPRGILLATQNARRRAKQISAATRRASTIAASSAQATGSTVAQAPLRTVMLPRRLARPVYRNVEEAAILAIEPELAGTSLQYIREKLQAVGSSMLAVLAATSAAPVAAGLPKEIDVIVRVLTSDLPTHMLAIYSPLSATETTRKVTLLPIHSIILATHCANLPPLPPSKPTAPDFPGAPITLPVVPLNIPHPATFPQLCAYLYTQRGDQLLASLLPIPPVMTGCDDANMKSSLQHLAHQLAHTYTELQLLQFAMAVNGMWRNVCALGIYDEKLWRTMEVAWAVFLAANV